MFFIFSPPFAHFLSTLSKIHTLSLTKKIASPLHSVSLTPLSPPSASHFSKSPPCSLTRSHSPSAFYPPPHHLNLPSAPCFHFPSALLPLPSALHIFLQPLSPLRLTLHHPPSYKPTTSAPRKLLSPPPQNFCPPPSHIFLPSAPPHASPLRPLNKNKPSALSKLHALSHAKPLRPLVLSSPLCPFFSIALRPTTPTSPPLSNPHTRVSAPSKALHLNISPSALQFLHKPPPPCFFSH